MTLVRCCFYFYHGRYSAVYTIVVCPSVRLSIRPSVVGQYCIETLRRIDLVLAWELPSTCVIRKYGYLHKLGYFPLGLCHKPRT